MKSLRTLSIFTLASVISYGCSSSSGGNSTPPSPNGIYTGSITGGQEAGGFNGGEKAAIYDGRMLLFSSPGGIRQIFNAPLTINNKDLNSTITIYDNSNAAKATTTATGTFEENQSVSIAFTNAVDANNISATGITDGNINLTANTNAFNQGANLSLLSDGNPSWQGTHSGFGNTTISFTSNGDFTGNESTENCSFNGTTSIPNTSKNLYLISITTNDAINCTTLPPSTYTGFMWFDENNNNTLNFIVADSIGNISTGARARAIVLTRN